MHELPKDLSHSLRSWRGSVRRTASVPDLEKGYDLELAEHDDESSRNTQLNAKGSTITRVTISTDGIHEAPESGDNAQLPPLQVAAEPVAAGFEKPRKQPTFPPQTPASAKKSIFAGAPKIADPDPAAERLNRDTQPLTTAQFEELIGIREPEHPHQHPRQLIIKGGLYHRIITQLRHVQRQYRMYDITAYVLLALQLLLSAVFIVLGALGNVKTHLAIAILGAISAVIAGALALMKGQGLPNRLRRFRDGLRAVVFEVEELFWDVGAHKEVYFRDIKKIREDFLRMMEVAERNHPDTWNTFTDRMGQPQGSSTTKPPAQQQ